MSPVQKTKRLLTKGKAALSTMLNTLTIMRSGVKGVFTDSADYLAFPARYVNDLRAVLDCAPWPQAPSWTSNIANAQGTQPA
ncbi:Uncharacterised protein [Edwardsiella tarda]|nr:Uncharacterised protein [Edwardsiella tarda]